MINEFGAKNFYSFKGWASISLRLDKKVPENIRDGWDATPVLGIKGANASGKTNVLRILVFIRNFVLNKTLEKVKTPDAEVDESIRLTNFYDSNDPSEFFIDFDYKGRNFLYELILTKDEILSEELSVRENVKRVKILERKGNKIVNILSKYSELKKIKLKKNVSIIHHVVSFEFDFNSEIFQDVVDFFSKYWDNIKEKGGVVDYTDSDLMTNLCAKWMYKDSEYKTFVVDIIKRLDLGISDIRVNEDVDSRGVKTYTPYFRHLYENQEKYLPLYLESNGTKKIFTSMVEYFLALRAGGILIIDEFDNYLHPLILPFILDWFTNKEINNYNAQFIFTSHNTEILDWLGKYRTLLVEKEDNESICYLVNEIPGVRNDRPLSDRYSRGQLGGVPNIG